MKLAAKLMHFLVISLPKLNELGKNINLSADFATSRRRKLSPHFLYAKPTLGSKLFMKVHSPYSGL